MADTFDTGGGFLLRLEFLNDDDDDDFLFHKPDGAASRGRKSENKSPVESVTGTTETESDDEDYLTGLTREMLHSTIGDDFAFDDGASRYHHPKARTLSGSPQSTLFNPSWGRGSSNAPSMNWDLVRTVSGEEECLQRRNSDREGGYLLNQNRALLAPHRKPSPISAPVKTTPLSDVGLYPNQSFSPHQMQPKQDHFTNQLAQNREGRSSSFVDNRRSFRPSGLPQPLQWPQQQPNDRGMRALFLGNNGGERSRTGTGVFIPKRTGTQSENRRNKPACSTVLLPPKVVHSLNLKVDPKEAGPKLHPPRHPGYADLSVRGNNMMVPQQMQRMGSQPGMMSQEMRLPQDWTY